MTLNGGTKPFPVPVAVEFGPGSQNAEDALDYITMPREMETYRPPMLPEPEDIVEHQGAMRMLGEVLTALRAVADGIDPKRRTIRIPLDGLNDADRVLINQLLGEGEVSAQVLRRDGAPSFDIQEAVFAGVWRLIETLDGGPLRDSIEVGAVPEILREVARSDGEFEAPKRAPLPQLLNVPSLLVELEHQRRNWIPGQIVHVVNLTLLPVTEEEIGYLDFQLGTGRVRILSRGYGNCRITNCCVSNTWRVVYYNSQDTVILNSVEVTDMPEVVLAAPEDLHESVDRLQEVLKWMAQG